MQLPPPQQPPFLSPQYVFVPPQPRKRSYTWLWILAIVAASIFSCIFGDILGRASMSPAVSYSSSNSAGDTSNAVWTITHNFAGIGATKTAIFTVGNDWKLNWHCTAPSTSYPYNLIVSVYNSDNTIKDFAINEICDTGSTQGSTEEHSGGDIYLDVNCGFAWNLTIQEPQ